ncbi:hypothetical protein [Qipengyuania marisflavi]|uniref:Transmembrane protein n=1 Tax=Qipengyuania marisflavi TaxID=2486356 RepID=A0A5S3P2Z1_9SPHN|nr:hypothetical protein [Qipengyuania marisflavi]TMM47158.1 hypothetical protein FEV51_10245 [Qipengyuania marisflavi]
MRRWLSTLALVLVIVYGALGGGVAGFSREQNQPSRFSNATAKNVSEMGFAVLAEGVFVFTNPLQIETRPSFDNSFKRLIGVIAKDAVSTMQATTWIDRRSKTSFDRGKRPVRSKRIFSSEAFAHYPSVVCRSLTCINQFTLKDEASPILKQSYRSRSYPDVSPQLSFARLAGNVVGVVSGVRSSPSFPESDKNQAQAEYTKRHPNNGRYSNRPRPGSHSALGLKISFIALALVGGLAFCRYAIAAARFRQSETFAFYSYVAGVSIGLSAFGGLMLYFEMGGFR